MRKKLIALLLMMTIISGFFPGNNVVKAKNHDSAYAAKIIDVLGIMDTDGYTGGNSGDLVTRGEFAQMLVNLSKYKDTVSPDTTMSLFKDVTSKYKGAGYIEFAITNDWMAGYIDGSFKPDKAVTLQEAVNGIVAVLGYTSEDFTGNKNLGKMSLYSSKNLDDNISKTKNQNLNRTDCTHLFYNTLTATMKDNTVYGTTLGYTIDEDGELSYLELVNKEMEGPLIAGFNWSNSIPFDTGRAAYYRNDAISSKASIETNDVIYYSENLKTIYAYSDKVTGIVKEILPNRLNPAEVVMAGETYSIGTKEMSYEFSTLGKVGVGDVVTILLGKDDTIVGVLGEGEYSTKFNGVVLDTKDAVTTDKYDKIFKGAYAEIVDSSGRKQQIEYEGRAEDYAMGAVVEVSYDNGKVTLTHNDQQLSEPLSGTVNENGTALGKYAIAKDARIVDVKNRSFVKTTAARLAGTFLYASDIYYYSTNSNREIDEMILSDVTGDLYDYGILLGSTPVVNDMGRMTTYDYIIDGTENSISSGDFTEMLTEGPGGFSFVDNQLDDIIKLQNVRITSIKGLEVNPDTSRYLMSDEVKVYYLSRDKYHKVTLNSVKDLDKYNLNGYYDKSSQFGGRIRVIIATDK